MRKNKYTLGIETAIQSGSLSILDGSLEIDFWVGTKAVSRSEDLLGEISALLKKNNINKNDIGLIAVSNSAGSYTGIRIGLATALGLKKALGCRISGVSVLEAIALSAETEGSLNCAVTSNGRDFYLQTFEKSPGRITRCKTPTQLLDYEKFCRSVFPGETPDCLYVNEKLYEFIQSDNKLKDSNRRNIYNAGKNLAKLIGRTGQEKGASDNVSQVFLKEFK